VALETGDFALMVRGHGDRHFSISFWLKENMDFCGGGRFRSMFDVLAVLCRNDVKVVCGCEKLRLVLAHYVVRYG